VIAGAVLLTIGGLVYGSMVILPSRLILKEKHLVVRSITGKVRAQIPYANIAEVRLHYAGEGDQEIQLVAIDLVKSRNRDTWWPRSFKGNTYDIEIHDDWVKPPNVIVRLIQEKMNRYYENVGRGGSE